MNASLLLCVFYISIAILPLLLLFGLSTWQFLLTQCVLWSPIVAIGIYKRRQETCLIKETEDRALRLTAESHYGDPFTRCALRDTAIMQYKNAHSTGVRGVYKEAYVCELKDPEARIACLLKGLSLAGARIYWRRTWIGHGEARSTCAVCLFPCNLRDSDTYAPFVMADYIHPWCALHMILSRFLVIRYFLLKYTGLLPNDTVRLCIRLSIPLCYDDTQRDVYPSIINT